MPNEAAEAVQELSMAGIARIIRQHEIAEAGHRILNPFNAEKLALLGTVCRLTPDQRVLDLACGKGELLATWAARYGIGGLGIDLSEVFLAAAAERARELEVADRVEFRHGDAGAFDPEPGSWDVACCVGATWIRGGLVGTGRMLAEAVRPDGLALVGEPFWRADPSAEACAALGSAPDEFATLAGTVERLADAGLETVELVVADADSWDRYEAEQWWTVDRWLRDYPDDPEAPAMREYLDRTRQVYLRFGRDLFGWAVFVTRPAPRPTAR